MTVALCALIITLLSLPCEDYAAVFTDPATALRAPSLTGINPAEKLVRREDEKESHKKGEWNQSKADHAV